MLSSDELGLLTEDERQKYAASNATERLYMANDLKNLARVRAVEKGVSLNGHSVQELLKMAPLPSSSAYRVASSAVAQSVDGTRYGVARGVIGLMDIIGWLVIAVGALLLTVALVQALGSFEETRGALPIFALMPGVGVMVAGIFLLANSQLLRATLDTADATKQLLDEMKKLNSRTS